MSSIARSLTIIVACQVGGMSLWFSASAAMPRLIATGELSAGEAGWMTSAVQLGFVAGTLVSAVLGLADRCEPRCFFFVSALAAALANAALIKTGFAGWEAILLRFLTGSMLAGVYPIGLKLAAGWASSNLGLLMGVLVGALTLGSAMPNLFNWGGSISPDAAIAAASFCGLLAACGILFAQVGPNAKPPHVFAPRDAWAQLTHARVRLVNIGYLGHMWELYAMWAWIGAFMLWMLQNEGWQRPDRWAALFAFLIIGSGSIGAIVAGILADRLGRAPVIVASLIISGTCAAAIGPASVFGPVVVMVIAIVWGISVIADSAQFSAALTEVVDRQFVGTMLTLQTCAGFLLTFISIQLISLLIEPIGWRYCFLFLTVGPLVGACATMRFRRLEKKPGTPARQ